MRRGSLNQSKAGFGTSYSRAGSPDFVNGSVFLIWKAFANASITAQFAALFLWPDTSLPLPLLLPGIGCRHSFSVPGGSNAGEGPFSSVRK